MGLRAESVATRKEIMADTSTAAGWAGVLTNPNQVSSNLTVRTNDISLVIDADTGQAVSGRTCTVVFDLEALDSASIGVPIGVPDESSKPWIFETSDSRGIQYKFKIVSTEPDNILGLLTCFLEVYL